MRPYLALLIGLLALPAQALPPATPQGDGYAVLIISRERLEVATPCEIGLYLQDQLAGRLHQGQSVSFNLPPGEVSLRMSTLGSDRCQPGMSTPDSQRITLTAGEVRRYRIALSTAGLYLLAAPSSQ